MPEERGVELNDGGVELVDRDACMGSGNCVFWAPTVFDLDEDGVAVVRGEIAGHEEEVRTAAKNCPTSAIRVDLFFPTSAA